MSFLALFLAFLGRHGKWVLPLGLVAGFLFPQAAQPFRHLITPCIALLLFLAVLRIVRSQPEGAAIARAPEAKLIATVLLAQLALPLTVFGLANLLGVAWQWTLALTLVAAAPPISGSPNLVLLMKGDATLALRWLMLATLILPLSCLPVLYLLYPQEGQAVMLLPSIKLLSLIVGSALAAMLIDAWSRRFDISLSVPALDGAASLTLAVMVVGLMSAIHAPDMRMSDFLVTLLIAIGINAGFQLGGVFAASFLKHPNSQIITTGVLSGNRNIALYLTALPASSTEPLLLFIACYQIPMYLTPLVGEFFYGRLHGRSSG